jgi:single-strand DNA-binding protein
MNHVTLCGRPTADPEVRYTQGENAMAVARYTLAVDRRGKDNGADFIRCVAFGKSGEFAEKWVKKGVRILISGRIQTGSYKDKEGRTVYTTDVVVENHEFADGKAGPGTGSSIQPDPVDEFMDIPEGEQEELPFV